jgi:hypothetical protein
MTTIIWRYRGAAFPLYEVATRLKCPARGGWPCCSICRASRWRVGIFAYLSDDKALSGPCTPTRYRWCLRQQDFAESPPSERGRSRRWASRIRLDRPSIVKAIGCRNDYPGLASERLQGNPDALGWSGVSGVEVNLTGRAGPHADSDEAGHAFRKEAGHRFRSEAGRDSELKPATQRSLPRIEAMMFRLGGLVKRTWISVVGQFE